MKYEEPNMRILMRKKDDVICSSMPGGIEDGTDVTIPGTEEGKDTGVFQ